METVNAVGRRKAAVARVILKEGTGVITINKRPLDVYFPSSILQYIVKQPLNTLDCAEKYDIHVNLDGGGYKGQAEALRLGIARALVKINPDDKAVLRKQGFMTRDPSSQNVNRFPHTDSRLTRLPEKCLVSKPWRWTDVPYPTVA